MPGTACQQEPSTPSCLGTSGNERGPLGQPGRQAARHATGQKGPERGPWGGGPGGGGGPGIPDLDDLIQRLQQQARRFVPGGPRSGRGNARLLGLIGLVALAVWLGSGFYRVQPDEQGVVLRFGAFQGYTSPACDTTCPGRSSRR